MQRDGDAGVSRLFIAVELTPAARRYTEEALRMFKEGLPSGVRWVRPEGIHLTLKFLGNVSNDAIPTIESGMRRAAEGIYPFTVRVQGAGCFPSSRRPRVLWLGLQGELESLLTAQSRLEDSLEALGVDRETRPFRSHLTVGRVSGGLPKGWSERLEKTLEIVGAMGPCDLPVDGLSLMESVLGKEGAVYTRRAFVVLNRR